MTAAEKLKILKEFVEELAEYKDCSDPYAYRSDYYDGRNDARVDIAADAQRILRACND